jgi:glycosyltransferase involved in cell wall biosynthesis
MKIAMLGIKGMPCPAGAETVAEELGSRLVERGHEVVVYVRPNYTPRGQTSYRGMRLVHLPSIATKNLDAITHSFLASLAVIKEKPDILHVHSTGSSIFSLHPRLLGIKTVVQSHGLDWQRAKWGKVARAYLKLTDYTLVHFPNAATAVSQKMQSYYQAQSGRKVSYIPNGVNPARRAEPKEIFKLGLRGNDYFFFAARLVKEKGAHYLIEAYRRLENPAKKLVIAGDGAYGDAYAADLKKEADQNILFPGFVRGDLLHELLSNAYAFVLPSEIEGLSTGLLEAMSYGNCVLVSDIEENLEAIGQSGVTFQNRSAGDLAEKLHFLLDNPIIVNSMRASASQHVRSHYDWDRVTQQFEQLYQSLLSST